MAEGHGLGLFMAIIFLSGEMAGVGVLALPSAMTNTGPAGLALLVYFTINAMFVGTRLGLCWVMVEERFPEYAENCRDPYMVIAEKAGSTFSPFWGNIFRKFTSGAVVFTLYGSCVLLLVLMSSFLENIFNFWEVDINKCLWMLIVAVIMMPLCSFGSPADFWFVAVGALISTVTGCVIVMVKQGLDVGDKDSCYYKDTPSWPGQASPHPGWEANHPSPSSFTDFGKAFSSILFAFAGASTFPTIQADMKDKTQFPKAAVAAMIVLFMIYMPTAASTWGLLGDLAAGMCVDSLCDGPVKIAVEVLFLIHLITAFPILMNPPSQLFENILNIPLTFGWKRVAFRSFMITIFLAIALSVPFFGVIVDLIGSTTITCLNFIFPPFFYMCLSDSDKTRKMSVLVRVYCWHMVVVGIFGMGLSFYKAIDSLIEEFQEGQVPCWVTLFE